MYHHTIIRQLWACSCAYVPSAHTLGERCVQRKMLNWMLGSFWRRPHNKEGGAEELASESSDSDTLCGYTQTFTYIERHHIATYNHYRIM